VREADGLRAAAEAVLRANDAGRWTKPSPLQYPHQWNWDSAFASLGWATFDWARACLEIESLLEAQWPDGMIPHLRYDPEHVADYFPGPDWWPGARGPVPTSGISNPPVLPIAAHRVGLRQPDAARRRDFWRRVLPGLSAWLRWFLDSRRPGGSRLPVLLHPWETGWDNSPRWDFLAAARLRPARLYERLDRRHVGAGERPGDRDYDAYLALAELIAGAGYDAERVLETSPFAVHDVVVDALWHDAAVAVDAMAAELGEPAPFGADVLAAYRADFDAVHRDEGCYDFDLKSGALIRTATAAGVASRAADLWDGYREASAGARPVPTVPPAAPEFEPARYWRGPVWVSVNWLVIRGLGHAGSDLRDATLDLVRREGFWEYFDALTGEGRGIAGFTWSAALTLDLLAPI
jgi:hypothetical protein